jgi:hypothetical protein
MKTKDEWVCTDPNMNQYGRKISDGVYEFKQDMKYPDGSIIKERGEVHLKDYSNEEINDHLSSFGYSIGILKDTMNEANAEWITAECIFEMTIF